MGREGWGGGVGCGLYQDSRQQPLNQESGTLSIGTHITLRLYLSDAMVNAKPEKQQSAEERCLEQPVQHAGDPAVHQERQWKQRIWKHKNKTKKSYMSKNKTKQKN